MIASTYTTLNAPTAEVKLPKAEPIVVPKDIISAPPKNVEDSLKQGKTFYLPHLSTKYN